MVRIQYSIYIISIILYLFSFIPNQNHNILYGGVIVEDPESTPSSFNLHIIFTGEENGYLEPCGCSEKRVGGLPKRHTLIEQLKGKDDSCVLLSLGDLTKEVGRQDEIKMETFLTALDQMGYAAHNIGEKDISMGLDLLSYLSQITNVTFISSNLSLEDVNIKPYIINEIKIDEMTFRVGILGILSHNLVGDDYLEVKGPVESLKPLIAELESKTDFMILLSHAEIEESQELAETFPELDLIISGHGIDEPDLYVKKVGNTYVVPVGEKGKYLGKVTIPIKYGQDFKASAPSVEIIPLDERYEDSLDMKYLLKTYQQRLKDEELVKHVFRSELPSDLAFTGNEDCGICHNKIFKHWQETHHASAYETLVTSEHEYDPECLTCHTIGMQYSTGFETIETTPKMKGVGCENCHGPGSGHKLIQSKDYGKVDEENCIICHNSEHSPEFQFKEYWQKIKHPHQ